MALTTVDNSRPALSHPFYPCSSNRNSKSFSVTYSRQSGLDSCSCSNFSFEFSFIILISLVLCIISCIFCLLYFSFFFLLSSFSFLVLVFLCIMYSVLFLFLTACWVLQHASFFKTSLLRKPLESSSRKVVLEPS